MKRMVLIGGGDVGRGRSSYQTEKIDKEIVRLTEKEQPNFLFIGLASSHSDSYYDTMKKIYKNLGCITVYLKKSNLIHNPDLVKSKIENADIIYISGGDTIKLLDNIKEYGLGTLLSDAYHRGCVLVGMSAGAIALVNEGLSDSYILRGESDKYKFIKGLSLYPISICPHYNIDTLKKHCLEDSLKRKDREVYSLENGTALKIEDNKLSVITSIDGALAYKVTYKDGLIEEKI